MKKIALFAVASLIAAQQAFAVYFVVLKNGNKYRARDKWTIVNGKALITLENGTQLQIDPTLIDVATTEQTNRSGLGDVTLLATGQPTQGSTKAPDVSLGDLAKLRKLEASRQATASRTPAPVPQPNARVASLISPDVLSRFGSVYENVGIFGSKASASGPASVRVELVADNEDQVFKAISATAYLITRLPGVANTKIDNVELFMTTIKGGAAGNFNMTAADAQAIDSRTMSLQKYFVERVLF